MAGLFSQIGEDYYRRLGFSLVPLAVLMLIFGIYPKPLLDVSAASVTQLLQNYHAALNAAAKSAALVN